MFPEVELTLSKRDVDGEALGNHASMYQKAIIDAVVQEGVINERDLTDQLSYATLGSPKLSLYFQNDGGVDYVSYDFTYGGEVWEVVSQKNYHPSPIGHNCRLIAKR